MKIFTNYKEDFIKFINNKKFMIPILIVFFLSYGFMLSHFSIGVDDLCLDRYVKGSYILSAGRWGTWLVYNILNINEYIPFWVDLVTLLMLIFTSVILCVFIKRITKNKLRDISYILFAIGFISFPIISCFMIYLPTKLTVVLSNLIMIIFLIIFYEFYFCNYKINRKVFIFLIFMLSFAISMYESCCQSFVVLSFIILFLYDKYNKKLDFKVIINFLIKVFGILLISILFNSLINSVIYFILDKFELLEINYAFTRNIFDLYKDGYMWIEIIIYKIGSFVTDYHYFTIVFLALIILSSIYVLTDSYKNMYSFVLYVFIMLSNYILIFILSINIYRVCYSWILTFAFILLYFSDRIKSKYIVCVAFLLVLFNTKFMNQYFYNDYRTYQRDLLYSNQIITHINDNVTDFDKPLLFVVVDNFDKAYDFENHYDSGMSVYKWGMNAFNEQATEIIKFINYLGYNFELVDNYDDAYNKYKSLSDEEKEKKIIELDDFIVVKINNYIN